MRKHVITSAETGETTEVPFTPDEEAERDAAEAAIEPAPPSETEMLRAELDKLRGALISKGVVTDEETKAISIERK